MSKIKILLLCVILSSVMICFAKKQMKILMVVATFPKIHDVCILNQITGLLDRGHDVHIFAFTQGDCVRVQEDVVTYKLIDRTMFSLPYDLNSYDIVIFQLGHKLLDIRNTHNYRGKIVVCMRGYDITGFLREHPNIYNKYFELCDLFLPVCNSFKEILENIGCDPRKIIVHHSAIDCSKFKFNPRKILKKKKINILSAGRFVEKKGFIYSIQAVARLIKKYPHIRYTIIGEGPLKNSYMQLIKQLHMENKIIIREWLAHNEYIEVLNQCHIFISPSVTASNNDQEGIPNVLKEAMATGLIVIATDHSGNNELIDNIESGFLVPERDTDSLYNILKVVINNKKTLQLIQQKAVQKIYDEFDKEKENDTLENILLDLITR